MMMYSEQQLSAQLSQAYQLTGAARFAAFDVVFRHADAAGLGQFAFNARMSAISDFHHGGDPTRAFLAFSWCLAFFDRHPDLVGSGHDRSLLWRFKWIVWALPQFPQIPLVRTQAVLDDMQHRYQLGGHSPHAVYQHRWLVADHVGDAVAARNWYDRMVTARRDGLSDCSACVPSIQVRYLSGLGRDEEAVAIGAPHSRGGCTEQPQWMLSELLGPYLRTGQLDAAVEAHRDGYRRMRSDRHHLDNIAQHVVFCGLTGNEARGLEIIERHVEWLERPSTPYAAMEFAAGSALVLGRLRAAGRGDLAVHRRSADGSRRWTQSVEQLHAELVAQARALAGQFDARNGNTHQSRRVETRMTLEPLVDRLPLTAVAGRTVGRGRSIPPDPLAARYAEVARLLAIGDEHAAALLYFEVATALYDAQRWNDATEAAEEAVRMLDRTGQHVPAAGCRWLLWRLYRRAFQRTDALAVMDELLQARELPENVPDTGTLLEEAADLCHGSAALTRLLTAADWCEANGAWPAAARILRKALGVLAYQPSSTMAIETVARAEALLAVFSEVDPGEAGQLEAAAARVLLAVGHVDEAIRRSDRAVLLLGAAGLVEALRAAALRRAEMLLAAGRAVDAETQARAVLAQDVRRTRWAAAVLVAKALLAQGRESEAAGFMSEHEISSHDLEDDYDDAEDYDC